MTTSDRLAAAPIHENKQAHGENMFTVVSEQRFGPVRKLHEEMMARVPTPLMTEGFQEMADFIDRLFAEQGERVEELDDRIAHHGKIINTRLTEIDALAGRLDNLSQRVERGIRDVAQALDIVRVHLSGRLDRLEDRLSMVHVQAQGDAKIRATAHWADLEGGTIPPDSAWQPEECVKEDGDLEEADKDPRPDRVKRWVTPDGGWTEEARRKFGPDNSKTGWNSADEVGINTEQPQPIARVPYRIRGWAEERIAELKEARHIVDGLFSPVAVSGRPVVFADEVATVFNTRIAALDSEIDAETQPADLDAQSTVERDARLDELDRIMSFITTRPMADRHDAVEFLGRRRREIEEGK